MEYVKNPNGNCRLCTEKDERGKLITCHRRDRWFHLSCLELTTVPKIFTCPRCKEQIDEKKELRMCLMQTEKLLTEKIEAEKRSKLEQSRYEDELERLQEIIRREEILNQTDAGPDKSIHDLTANIDKLVTAWSTGSSGHQNALLNLPEFEGNCKSWASFKSIFDETTKRGNFSNLENMNRLHKFLKGDALKAVEGLMINPNNVDAIIDRLDKLYGNPDALPTNIRNDWILKTIKEPGKLQTLTDLAEWIKSSEELAINLAATEGGFRSKTHRLNHHSATAK
uniref:Zinc finger PHD-type domain-containing protein n=1 Tax=Anopheles epiroticus TaxID=199890 RepID=A0A182PX10_9DIPT